MKHYLLAFIILTTTVVLTAMTLQQPPAYDADTPVASVLIALGDEPPEHYIGNVDMEKVSIGKDIVITGAAFIPDGTTSKRVSEFYTCVDCHNVRPETEFADNNDPDSRLAYAQEFNLPYLPGSTFYGIVNRTSWFNGDHEKKYGEELVKPARHDLKGAIQLCSKECSVGRHLEDWEMEAVLHFFSSLELKMKDLDLTDEERAAISAPGQTEEEKQANIALLKSKYLQGYPATFVEELPKDDRGMGQKGDADRGKYIYEKSCLHCHGPNKTVTDRTIFGSEKKQKDFDWLQSYFHKSNGGSIYWITRHGTESKNRIPQYMPIYSKEKLTDAQIEDLAAYILKKSEE